MPAPGTNRSGATTRANMRPKAQLILTTVGFLLRHPRWPAHSSTESGFSMIAARMIVYQAHHSCRAGSQRSMSGAGADRPSDCLLVLVTWSLIHSDSQDRVCLSAHRLCVSWLLESPNMSPKADKKKCDPCRLAKHKVRR